MFALKKHKNISNKCILFLLFIVVKNVMYILFRGGIYTHRNKWNIIKFVFSTLIFINIYYVSFYFRYCRKLLFVYNYTLKTLYTLSRNVLNIHEQVTIQTSITLKLIHFIAVLLSFYFTCSNHYIIITIENEENRGKS